MRFSEMKSLALDAGQTAGALALLAFVIFAWCSLLVLQFIAVTFVMLASPFMRSKHF